jgi:hypothetical protein
MSAASHPRGSALLMSHCAALADERASVSDRLEELIGPALTRLLVVALVGDHRMVR